ncbi:hypothetical protein N0V85_008667, partial [Neurospora sp. IMI 360204]
YAAMPEKRLVNCTTLGCHPCSIRNGIMGIALVFASTTMNPASKAQLVTRAATTGTLDQGYSLPPKLNPKSCTTSPTTSSVAPVRSRHCNADRIRPFGPVSSTRSNGFSSTKYPTTRATKDTGTCDKKHHLHPMVSAMVPPRDAPSTDPNP